MIRRFLILALLSGALLIGCGSKTREPITEETLRQITVTNAMQKADELLKELDDDF